jgi:hypothetical protein
MEPALQYLHQNFLEIFIIEPREGQSINDPALQKDLQWIISQCTSGTGALSFAFRKSVDHPERFIFIGAWKEKVDHDDLDIRGVTPKMLKILLERVKAPLAVYYLLVDASKVELDAEVLGIDAFYVKEEHKAGFQREIDERGGVVGAWYVTKGIPPRPTVMPTDHVEVKIIEEGEARAEARLKMSTPDIWVSFSTPGSAHVLEEFGNAVKSLISKVESGKYEKFLSG